MWVFGFLFVCFFITNEASNCHELFVCLFFFLMGVVKVSKFGKIECVKFGK